MSRRTEHHDSYIWKSDAIIPETEHERPMIPCSTSSESRHFQNGFALVLSFDAMTSGWRHGKIPVPVSASFDDEKHFRVGVLCKSEDNSVVDLCWHFAIVINRSGQQTQRFTAVGFQVQNCREVLTCQRSHLPQANAGVVAWLYAAFKQTIFKAASFCIPRRCVPE